LSRDSDNISFGPVLLLNAQIVEYLLTYPSLFPLLRAELSSYVRYCYTSMIAYCYKNVNPALENYSYREMGIIN